MTSKEIVKNIMSKNGMSQEKLAIECGMKRQSNVTGVLNRYSSMRVDILEKMINAMGYELVIRPIDGADEEYVVHEEKNMDGSEET